MALTSPNLDDRTFQQLLEEAHSVIRKSCPEWSDLSPNDPGMVMVELFAWLTETLIYRVNRLPEKAYVEFLRLMGVQLHPPSAAQVKLRFTPAGEQDRSARIEIPRGTRVSVVGQDSGADAPIFVTSQTVALESGQDSVEVLAIQCQQVDGELLGVGTGRYGLSAVLQRTPIIAPSGDGQDLVVGVEATLDEIGNAHSRKFGDKTFRIWTEVSSFGELDEDRFVYVTDRRDGRITFAPAVQSFALDLGSNRPAAIAEAPAEGREIRVWYRFGGGEQGNVAANKLTLLKDPLPGVNVVNPFAANGGRDAEELEDALQRGPQELHSLKRTVTARDFERLATSGGGVARARAFTKAQVWAHAEPGTVEVLLVPAVPHHSVEAGLSLDTLREHQDELLRQNIHALIDQRRPLGTRALVNWVGYQRVRVRAKIVAFRGEEQSDLELRVKQRLNALISPLATPEQPAGWPFGLPLRVARIYDAILKEPGVKDVERLRLVVDEVPAQQVNSLVSDQFQPHTWHTLSDRSFFRSVDDGHGWQRTSTPSAFSADEQPRFVRAHPVRAGWLAAVTRFDLPSQASNIYVSEDCGESWRLAQATAFEVNDVQWIVRDGVPAILIASARGLYQLTIAPGAGLEALVVGDLPSDLGFWSVAVINDVRGQPLNVCVAAAGRKGLWISYEQGRSKTFVPTNLKDEDVRVLAVQHDGSRSFFWAGCAVTGNEPGRGCFRWEGVHEGWAQYLHGWRGGSCYALTLSGPNVLAATYDGGVLVLNTSQKEPIWQAPAVDCGLPRRDDEHPFARIRDLDADPSGRVVMAGTEEGVFRSLDQGRTYESVSQTDFTDSVSLPESALFCSGVHELTIVGEDAQE